MAKIRKPISILLSLILILGVFTIIPVAAEGASYEFFNYYIDENGVEQIEDSVTPLLGRTVLESGWYAAINNTWSNDRILCYGDVNLILCDDVTLNVNGGIGLVGFPGIESHLTIYGQSLGTGVLSINYQVTENTLIDGIPSLGAEKNASGAGITINGGNISVTRLPFIDNSGTPEPDSDNAAAIGGSVYNNCSVTINGGNVTASNSSDHCPAIFTGLSYPEKVTINGGNVRASSVSDVILSWKNDTDSITVDYYHGSITRNKYFIAGSTVIPPGDSDINYLLFPGVPLLPAYGISWKNYDGTTIKTDYVKTHTTPVYNGETPQRAPDDWYTYTFSNWTPEIVPATEDTEYTAVYTANRFKGHSLTLDGDIGVNFFVGLTDEELDSGAVVDFAWTVEGEEKTATVTLTADDKTADGYRATCPVAVAEMTCDVTAALTVGGEQLGTDTYSVKRYGDTILSNDYKTAYLADDHTEEDYAKLETLVKTMLDYGTKAQNEFDRNTFDLANEDIDYKMSKVTADMIPSTASDMESGLDAYGLEYAGTTIVYLTKTSMRHYYTVTDQTKFNAVKDSITFSGEKAEYKAKDGKIYFELTDIAAADLDTPYTLTIGTNDYQYSVLDYVRVCLNAANAPANTRLLVCATYWYNQAANAYFGR